MIKFKSKIRDYRLSVGAKFTREDQINENELEYFKSRYVRGFLRTEQGRAANRIEYTGPVAVSLLERLGEPVTTYEFLFIIEQIVEITRKAARNGLCVDKIVFNISNVYINKSTKELQFIYTPIITVQYPADILGFIQSLLYYAKPASEQDSDSISRFAYTLNGMTHFNADQVEAYIKKTDAGIIRTIRGHDTGSSGFMTDKRQDYYAHYSPDSLQGEEGQSQDYSGSAPTSVLDETTLLSEGSEETTLLENTTAMSCPRLRRQSTGEDIAINKPVFRLGKERSYADYFVSNNTAVSRSHADIVTRGGRYFVIDLNSKNKTFINNASIPPRQETEIHDGDALRLANEEFVFFL